MKKPSIYIVANRKNGTIYTGVTSDLVKRIYEHKHGLTGGFTKKHRCQLLIFYEVYETMEAAITREKQIKNYSRKNKVALIEATNFYWRDLYEEII